MNVYVYRIYVFSFNVCRVLSLQSNALYICSSYFQSRPLFLNHPTWDHDHCKYHTVDAPVTV